MDNFELYIDSADIDQIKECDELLNVQGVTTNPTILTRSGKAPEVAIKEIIDYLRPDQKLFMQVVSTDYDTVIEEARFIAGLRPQNMVVKVPATHYGLKAIKQLESEGIHTLATTIYSADTGFMAAHNGAEYLAPYVNRMCNFGGGMRDVLDLLQMLKNENSNTKVLGASFKNADQAHDLIAAGVQALTLPPDVALTMVSHPGVPDAMKTFCDNWEKAYGRKTLRA